MESEKEKKPYKVVYTVVERKRDGKPYWVRIGAAFTNRDNSLSVHLDAVPTNGTLQIRDPDESRFSRFGGGAGARGASTNGNGNGGGHGNGGGYGGDDEAIPADVFSS